MNPTVDTDTHDMRLSEHNVFATVTAALFGALMPAAVVDVGGKVAIAFACGFVSLAGQACWRAVVRKWYDMRAARIPKSGRGLP